MAQLNFGDITYNESAYDTGYDQYQQTTWDVTKAAAGQAWEFNPKQAIGKYFDMQFARAKEKELDQTPIPKDELNKQYADLGLHFDEDEYGSVVDIIVAEKQEERKRQSIIQRGPKTAGAMAAKLGAGLVTSVADPVNLMAAFIPVFGQARFAALVARTSFGKARFIRGTVEGAVGAAIVEPIVYNIAQELQADYTLADSFLNVTFGGLMGGGLHVGVGKLKDLKNARMFRRDVATLKEQGKLFDGQEPEFNPYKKYYPENSRIMKELAETDPATRRMLLEKAGNDLLSEKPVDVGPVLERSPRLKSVAEQGEGPNEVNRVDADQIASKTDLNNQEQNIIDKKEVDIDVDIENLSRRLNDKRVEQTDLDFTPDPELELTLKALDEIDAKSQELDDIIKDAINCVNGR